MRNWLDEIDLGMGDAPMNIMCDNLGAISITETNRAHGLSKHIDTKYMFARKVVEQGKVAVYPVSSSQNISDIMTKSLTKDKHRRIVRALGLDWRYQDTRGSVKE